MEETSLRLRLSGILRGVVVEKVLALLKGWIAEALRKEVREVEYVREERIDRRRMRVVDMFVDYI